MGYRSAAGPPISRGRPCVVGPPGTPVSPCPLTDGNLANTLRPPATTTTAATASTVRPAGDFATVDLGRAADVSLVVVRGCSCEVERSADGQTWTGVGRATGYTAVVPSRTGPARFIRLTGSISQLREVSVWEGAATAPVSVPSEPTRTVPALSALALLVLAAIGTAAGALVAGRR